MMNRNVSGLKNIMLPLSQSRCVLFQKSLHTADYQMKATDESINFFGFCASEASPQTDEAPRCWLLDARCWIKKKVLFSSSIQRPTLLNRVPSRLPRLRENNPPAMQGTSGQAGNFNQKTLAQT
jgi:hypothetical protein